MGFIKTLENIYLSVPTFIICLYQVLYLHKILNDEKPSNHLEKIYFPMAIISIIICCIMIITLTYIIISDDSLSKIESIPLTILGSITLILTLYNLIMTKNKKKPIHSAIITNLVILYLILVCLGFIIIYNIIKLFN
jgi:hypothetical protein